MMFFVRVLISFTVLTGILLLALAVHSAVNKRRILRQFRAVAPGLAGHVSQDGLLTFPRLDGTYRGRQVALFFQSRQSMRSGDGAKDGDGPRLTYLVVTLSARTAVSLLVLKQTFFKPVAPGTLAAMREAAGDVISDGPAYQVRSRDPEPALALYRQPAVQESLQSLWALDHVVGLVLGPDSVVASMPYTDLTETEPTRLIRTIECLDAVAVAMERTP